MRRTLCDSYASADELEEVGSIADETEEIWELVHIIEETMAPEVIVWTTT